MQQDRSISQQCVLTFCFSCVTLLAGRKRKKSSAVRQLLMYRKNLATLLDEAVSTRRTRVVAAQKSR